MTIVLNFFAGLCVCALLLFLFSYGYQSYVESRYPPVGELVEVTDGVIHVREKGSGRSLVLIHGASSNLRGWPEEMIDELARTYRVITLDRPGHGWSKISNNDRHKPRQQARIIHEALKHRGVHRPLIVGHSLGGAIALAYALEYPDNIDGLLFLSGVSHSWPGGVDLRHHVVLQPMIGRLVSWTVLVPAYLMSVTAGIASAFDPNAAPGDYRSTSAMDLYARPESFRANARELVHLKEAVTEMSAFYRGLKTPLIAVDGSKDEIVSAAIHTEPLMEKIKNSETITLDGIGHMPHVAATDEVIRSIHALARKSELSKQE